MNAPLNATLNTDLPSKLSKLIRRLSSEHDGEVVATVRAINRTLKGAGHDLHKLADVVEQFGSIVFRTTSVFVASPPTWTRPPKPEPKPKMKPAPRWKRMGTKSQKAWLDQLAYEYKEPFTCGGLPHAEYIRKFQAYRERFVQGDASFNKDEIALIDRWIDAFWHWQKWERRP